MKGLGGKLQLKKLFKAVAKRPMIRGETTKLMPKIVEIYAAQWSREHHHLFNIKSFVNGLNIEK